jgi:hypothetical protein
LRTINVTVKTDTDKTQYRSGEIVKLYVSLTNQGPDKIDLDFSSSQRYDFQILKGKVLVWQWSNDLMFAMALESITLKAGETLTFKEKWQSEDATLGLYTLVGRIASQPVYEAKCSFTIA